MKKTIKLTFQITVALVIVLLVAMVVTGCMILLRVNMIAKDLQLDVRTVPAGTSDTQAFFTYFVREIFMVWLDGIKVAIF